ncbi:hypothetical protein LUZ63_020588 [Rhynchospora breviuscula]|uniref:NADH:quinone oxidoreductase/Mrp antiporter transmembrane domain-containing protein n=1 Tax=Rhynchospora breviuscula TaxID=2022672 RepID=A0A9P9Z8G6_9POAL|nr:hypothetical protein LUZ63_020588 [Rhynchospora breviuscula]
MNPYAMLPEGLLFVGALATLATGSFVPRRRQALSRAVALAFLALAGVTAGVGLAGPATSSFDATYAVDTATGVVRLLVVVGTVLVLLLAVPEVRGNPRESEFYALVMLASTGTVVLAGAADLLVLIAAFFLASIPLYALIGMARGPAAAEAAVKTYLLGALFGILLMLGVTLVYGVAGGTGYASLADRLEGAPPTVVAAGGALVVLGLLFKAGAVPAHFWVPDAAEGTWVAAATYATTIPKVGAVVAVYRLVDALPGGTAGPLVAVLAVASMTLGNLAALSQEGPRRLLGWSTVSQVGYLLVPAAAAGRSDLALPALLVYLAAYVVTNTAAFAVVAAVPWRGRLADYRGAGRGRPVLAGSLLVALLGLLGTPPTAVFVAKVAVSAAAWDAGSAWLAVAVLLNTVLSLAYYLRWVAPVFARVQVSTEEDGVANRGPLAVAAVSAAASVAVGLLAGVLWSVLVAP